MNKDDIVMISNFPFTDYSGMKIRPALVISNKHYNKSQTNVIVALITSKINKRNKNDYLIDNAHPEFKATGLVKPSLFRMGTIFTLHNTLIQGKIGIIGKDISQKTNNILRVLLQLTV